MIETKKNYETGGGKKGGNSCGGDGTVRYNVEGWRAVMKTVRSCELVNSINPTPQPMFSLPAVHKQHNVLAKTNVIYMHTSHFTLRGGCEVA
jgi:hypothetical protein